MILELAGVKAPGYMQGRSFVPLLQGKTLADLPSSTYYRYWMHMAHHDNPAGNKRILEQLSMTAILYR